MATHFDFKGQTTKYVYDDTPAHGGRLLEQQRFTGAADDTPDEKTVYGYDTLGRQNVVDEYADGDMATPMRHTKTDYDPITGGVIKIDSPEGVLQHEYDSATGRLKRTYTANNDTAYTYDAQGRLWKVIVSKLNGVSYATPLTTTYAYDKAGNLLSTVSDEGTATPDDNVSESDTYDPMNRLTGLTAKVGSHAIFDQGGFTYAPDGQKTGLLEDRYDKTTGATTATTRMTWTYDADGRLTSEQRDEGNDAVQNNGDYTDTYTFDPNGNRLTKTHDAVGTVSDDFTQSTCNPRDELATTQTNGGPVVIPQYDPDGNTLSDGSRTYMWDLRNRMTSVTTGGVTTTYAYDENGVRVSKKVGTAPTRTFLNDDENPTGYAKPVEEDVNGSSDTSYVLGLSVLGQSNATTGYLSLVQDGQGKTRSLINLSGVDVQQADYDAYGNALAVGLTATPWQNPDGYTDFESGLTQQLARSADRASGEWKSEDPKIFGVGEYQNSDLNIYVGGSPLLHLDPSGHDGLISVLSAIGVSSIVSGITSVVATRFLSTPAESRSTSFADAFARGFLQQAFTGAFLTLEVAFPPLAILGGPFIATALGNITGGLAVDGYEGLFGPRYTPAQHAGTLTKEFTVGLIAGSLAKGLDHVIGGDEFYPKLVNAMEHFDLPNAVEYVALKCAELFVPSQSTLAQKMEAKASEIAADGLASSIQHATEQGTLFTLVSTVQGTVTGVVGKFLSLFER